jgi:perosamine synthetase
VLYVGAKPVFVDVEPTTGNIDASAIPESLSERTRVVLPVHLFGLCADLDAIRAACPSDVRIVEDAACALGGRYGQSEAGTVGEIGCFSFHPRKSITTAEGGMIVTSDESLSRAARELRNHGLSTADPAARGGPGAHYMPDVERLGYNYRMSDVHAAIGLAQLPKLDRFLAERAQWARWYHDALADIEWLKLPPAANSGQSAWQSFVTTVSDEAPLTRNEIMARLKAAGIETRPGTQAVTDLAYYRERFNIRAGRYPIATMLERQSLTLPLHNGMSADDYAYVADTLHKL